MTDNSSNGDTTTARPDSQTRATQSTGDPAMSDRCSAVRQRVAQVGLYNSGALCYLNSLLQALYSTPEMRRLVFAWRPTAAAQQANGAADGSGVSAAALKRSVPYQLQLLFARLALSRSRTAVDTTALTHSFGWSAGDNMHQHDVQELMRVLFGALELAWGGGSGGGGSSLASLYTGTMLDVVQCSTCGARRERIDPFQDVQLSVAGCASLRASLAHFVAPEQLQGVRCSSDKCNGAKSNATKTLQLRSLPAVLTFQLKRFVFDFTLMQRAKLNDALDIPAQIDLAEFLCPVEPVAKGGVQDAAPPSSTLYELFAILMHSGVAQGGHYFALLRSSSGEGGEGEGEGDGGTWCEYNDANVWALSDGLFGALKSARGGGESKGGCSAYMVMYRRVEAEPKAEGPPHPAPGQAALVPPEQLISAEVRALVAAEEAAHEAEAARAELERRTIDMTVSFHLAVADPPASSPSPPPPPRTVSLHLDMGTEMQHLLSQLCASFALPATVLPGDLRLRAYDPDLRWASTVYPHDSGLTIEKAGIAKRSQLLLEQRAPGQEWTPYVADTIPLRCVFVTPANVAALVEQSLHPQADGEVFVVAARRSEGLASLRASVVAAASAATGRSLPAIPSAANQRLLLLHESRAQLLRDENPSAPASLDALGLGPELYPGRWLYVEHALEPELLRPTFERLRCRISICFNEPAPAPAPPAAAASGASGSDGAAAGPDAARPAQPDYCRSVSVCRNDSLALLKKAIGAELDLDPSGFRLSRNATAPQFKDEDATLAELQLVDQSGVFVSLGRPLQRDEFQVRFFLHQPEVLSEAEPAASTSVTSIANTDESAATVEAATASASTPSGTTSPSTTAAAPASRFLHLFELPIRGDTRVSSLKQDLLSYLAKKRPHPSNPLANGWGIAHVRVREKKGTGLGRVMEDARTLAECLPKLEDGAELALQPLDSEEIWTRDCMMLQLQQWHPRPQRLGPVSECVVRRNVSVAAFKHQLRRMLHPEDVAATAAAGTDAGIAVVASSGAAAVPASADGTEAPAGASSPPPIAAAATPSAAAPTASSPPIFLALGKLTGRMKRADALKLAWQGKPERSDTTSPGADPDAKLLRNALAVRGGELVLFYEQESPEEKARLDAARDRKKAAAAAAAAAEASCAGSTDATPSASTPPKSASAPLKPWQRGGGGSGRVVRKPGASVSVPARPPPAERSLRIGLSPEQEAACVRAEEEEAQAAAVAAAAASPSALDAAQN